MHAQAVVDQHFIQTWCNSVAFALTVDLQGVTDQWFIAIY